MIQTIKCIITGQLKLMSNLIHALERATGFRLRAFCQSYPYTTGLAIRKYCSLGQEDEEDDKYIVLVVDGFGGNMFLTLMLETVSNSPCPIYFGLDCLQDMEHSFL